MITKNQIKNYMLNELAANPDLYIDSMTGEISATTLAESAAQNFNRFDWLDDETADVWDIAVEVSE